MGLTVVFVERVRIPVCRKHNWKGKEIQTKVINAEQALWQGANRFPFDKQWNWWLSSSFLDRKKKDVRICCWRNLPPNLTIKTQLATPGKKIPEQQGKTTHENTLSFDLRRTNSITRKLCLATAINWHYWHFLTLAFLTAFLPPSLSSLALQVPLPILSMFLATH